ncbi:MAG: DUF3109 family protein [Bacteroidales bacterium]|nr:DUF3109 family protein [Bacteroidales bacterium]
MIPIDNTIVSQDIASVKFVCDLKKCKGACCVEGDAGAPLEREEAGILADIYEDIKPYMRREGIEAIEKTGVFDYDKDGDMVTPLVDGRECAYAIFDENKVAGCAIEKAYEDGKVDFRKPISCHLYPARVTINQHNEAVNYHRWHICEKALLKGRRLNVPVYKFLKEALIRKYGKDWYDGLEKSIEHEQESHKKPL